MDTRKRGVILLLLCALLLCACAQKHEPEAYQGQIYLYGEAHADSKCLEKELALWGEFYANGSRHLFVEMPCYVAAYLNEWMHADSDDILNRLYHDSEGTQSHAQNVLDFYHQIKQNYPETIFHGTDVGHLYDTTGVRYLAEMRAAGQEESEAYKFAQEIVEQGRTFYAKERHNEPDQYAYRENCMAENFIREYEQLSGANVMGIYGSMHTDPESMDVSGSVDSMAKQLAARYGDALHTENLSYADPVRKDRLQVGEKEYDATYYGSQDLSRSGFPYRQREFWRLEDAYEDFASCPLTGEVLPYNNYPMQIEEGQVYVIDYTETDGTVERRYYRTDGLIWNNLPTTQAFSVDN